MNPRIGVVLSGCGVFDGAEIHESVLTLLALDRANATALICAPDIPQMHVIDHLEGEIAQGETRNVLVESARIARGAIRDVTTVRADEIDGLMLPGGFGAAKNLCDFATKGAECRVDEGVARLLRDVHRAGKPIAAICIAPAVLARVLGEEGIEVTTGDDPKTAAGIEAMGARHVNCPVKDFVVDEEKKIITSPAYMLATRISEVAEGIDRTVQALLRLAGRG